MSVHLATGRALAQAVSISLAIFCALAVAGVSLASSSPSIIAVLSVLFISIIFLTKVSSIERSLIFLVFLVAPIDISKSIVGITDLGWLADAPGFAIALLDVPMIALGVCWIWRAKMREHTPITFTGLQKAALIFLAWIWISAFRAPSDTLAVASAAHYSKYILYFIIISNVVRGPEDWKAVTKATCVGVALTAIFVAAQVATRSPITLPGVKVPPNSAAILLAMGDEGSALRPVGLFIHPNTLADYMVLVLPTALSILLLGPRFASRQRRFWALAIFLVGSGMLVLTLSRGGWVCLMLGAAVCIFAYTKVGLIGGKKLVVGGVLALASLAVVVTSVPSIWNRITGPDSRSNEGRRLLVQQAYQIIGDHPLIGVGFGVYNRASQAYTPRGFAYVGSDFQKGIRQLVVHNHYLLLCGELGIPALLFYCSMFLWLLKQLFPLQKWTDPTRLSLAIGLNAALAANLLFFSSDNYYVDIRLALFWILIGLIQALLTDQKRESMAQFARTAYVLSPGRSIPLVPTAVLPGRSRIIFRAPR